VDDESQKQKYRHYTLIIKQLPLNITQQQLQTHFTPYGNIDRVVIKTSKDEAQRKAFIVFNYSYPTITQYMPSMIDTISGHKVKVFCVDTRQISKTIFIGNLPHDVDRDTLKSAFVSCGDITFISIHHNDDNSTAYLQFGTHQQMLKAVEQNGVFLEGKQLRVMESKLNTKAESKQLHIANTEKRRLERNSQQNVRIKQVVEDEFVEWEDGTTRDLPFVNMKRVNKENKVKLFKLMHVSPKRALRKSTKLFKNLGVNLKKIRNQKRREKQKKNTQQCKRIKIIKK
jgi:RNA recognition motif-containing protein